MASIQKLAPCIEDIERQLIEKVDGFVGDSQNPILPFLPKPTPPLLVILALNELQKRKESGISYLVAEIS
jgi:hypothetical protein